MRTITGRVRPFGAGTNPCYVRVTWPEEQDEIEEALSDLVKDGLDPFQVHNILAAKKAMIYVQDAVRNDDRWEDREAPDELDQEAWGEIQAEVNNMVESVRIDYETYPGEKKSGQPDELEQAEQDPEAAQELIAKLQARHGL